MTGNKKPLPVGFSDFRELRESGCYYIDKSLFIKEITEAWAKVLLIPRPRRFGKTLNLSMLRYFYEKNDEDRCSLFNGLAVSNDDMFKTHQGKYPVIFLTFKDLKDLSWESLFKGIANLLQDEFVRHEILLKSEVLSRTEKQRFEFFAKGEAGSRDYADSLRYLSRYLRRHYDKRVVILIDEYDTPLHAGYAGGFYEEVVSFIRNLLSGGLKDNEHLFKGVVTGVLRVAKESVFSGLGVYTLLSPKFSDSFGFTDPEVRILLEDFGMSGLYDKLSHWYNGYLFGKTVLYNPWSVLNCLDNQGDPQPYWINTADTGMNREPCHRRGQRTAGRTGTAS
ncbi:MAG: AAA family ATPase [Desulfobacteraceae bacterium]|nr:AAA family ATPase [Desulfobacteraceae bacterium]